MKHSPEKSERRDAAMRALADRRAAEIRLRLDKNADAKIERFDFEGENITARD